MQSYQSSNGTVKAPDITLFVSPYTAEQYAEMGRKADDVLLTDPEPPRPMLVNGMAYATLTIPDPKGKAPAKVYRVYPIKTHDGQRIPGRVKLWRREPDGTATTYKVSRKWSCGEDWVECDCPGYTHHGHCKHSDSCHELGIV